MDPIIAELIEARKRTGRTLTEVARASGVSRSTLWEAENSVHGITLSKLRAWAAALDVNLTVAEPTDPKPLNLSQAEVRERLEFAFRQAAVDQGRRDHALWCAAMAYNGWLGDRAKYPEADRITDLAAHFESWLARPAGSSTENGEPG